MNALRYLLPMLKFFRRGVLLGILVGFFGAAALAAPGATRAPDVLQDLQQSFTQKGRTLEDGSIWIDAATLRYMLEPLVEKFGPEAQKFLDRVQGARLKTSLVRRGSPAMKTEIAVHFDRPFRVVLKPFAAAKNLEPYAVDLPKIVYFTLTAKNGKIFVTCPFPMAYMPIVNVKILGLPERVIINGIAANLEEGNALVEVGILGGMLKMVVKVKLYDVGSLAGALLF